MSETTIHRWPAASLAGDFARGGVGFAVTLFLLLVLPVASIAFAVCLILALVFGFYLADTARKLASHVELDEGGVRVTRGVAGGKTIRWGELERFELRYYSLRRDRKEGWMDLTLKGGGRTIKLDDRLDRFDRILACAFEAARTREVGLSQATYANLIAAGLLPKPRS
jgi:hypothetical protein